MVLELTQMLFTAHHKNGTCPVLPYKPISNPKHPIAIWVRMDVCNYIYTTKLAKYLSIEYTHRYGKIHACDKLIDWLIINKPTTFPTIEYSNNVYLSYSKGFEKWGLSKIPLAMPDEYKSDDTISSYRKYYINDKKSFAKWTKRNVPYWFNNKIINLFK